MSTKIDLDEISEKILVVNINKLYDKLIKTNISITDEDIYRISSYTWKIPEKRLKHIDYVWSEYKGKIKGIYAVTFDDWYPEKYRDQDRFSFETDRIIKDSSYHGKEIFRKKGHVAATRYSGGLKKSFKNSQR